jgi:anti-anti-sigma factor
MKLSMISIEKAGYVKLLAEGDITSGDLMDAKSRNPLESVLGASWASNNVLLSLAKTPFIDSSAIGWLLDTHNKMRQSGGKLVPHSAQPRVSDLFSLLKLATVLDLKDDEASAHEFMIAGGKT